MKKLNFLFFLYSLLLTDILGRPVSVSDNATLIALSSNATAEDDKDSSSVIRGFYKNEKRWPKGIVYYKYDVKVGESLKSKFRIATTAISAATNSCITFKEESMKQKGVIVVYQDEFSHMPGCYAEIGYHPDKTQVLVLNFGNNRDSCDPGVNGAGVAVHELMHALGLGHEFQRHDRDNWIKIDKNKVKRTFGLSERGYQQNFGVLVDDTMDIPYNFRSIMNYDLESVITVVDNKQEIPIGSASNLGQICAISIGDRNLIQKTYYKECQGPNGKPIQYTSPYKLKGSDCMDKLEIMNDEME